MKLRGEAMQRASESTPSAMTSVIGCDDVALGKLIAHVIATTRGKLLVCT